MPSLELSVEQVSLFQVVKIDGIILAKLDADVKGGNAISCLT